MCWHRVCARIELVVRVDRNDSEEKRAYTSSMKDWTGRLFASDALELVDIEDLLKGVPVAKGFEQLKAADLDVLVNFAGEGQITKFASVAKHGVWFYSLAKRRVSTKSRTAFPSPTRRCAALQGKHGNRSSTNPSRQRSAGSQWD